MNTIQITIQADEPQQEILIGQLSEMGAEGFEQQDNQLLVYFPENNFNSYEVNQVLKDREHTTNTLEEKNWNEVWESNFCPVIVDEFCAVRADFHPPAGNVTYEIIITPKMSFGTGHHATTYMMIRQMKDLDLVDKMVFDFGTGTGILAILAEKMGARAVSGIDVDEWSIRNAEENIAKNNCTKTSVELSSELPSNKFDVILANINRNVILEYMEELRKLVFPGGYILFSGLLVSDEPDIISASGPGMKLEKREERQNWLSLLFKQV